MDDSYQEESSSAAVATTHSYKVDSNWYSDTGAIDHITSDLDRLAVRECYNGSDQVQVGNGAGLCILHTGHSLINTATRPFVLHNILHVPNISKHLLSVHKFSHDNDAFFEYHSWHCSLKDRQSRKVLLEGRCESGLYPIKPSDAATLDQALLCRSTSHAQCRLGHPSSQIVQSILCLNNISCASESSSSVCNVCQLSKSYQLLFLVLYIGHLPHWNWFFLMSGDLRLSLLGVLNIISVSSMTLVNFLGFIWCMILLRLLASFYNFKLILNVS
jgi:hypothetical protein